MNYSRSLGHFLENRGVFLKNINSDILKNQNSSHETNLLNNLRTILQAKSSSVSNDLTVSMMLNCSMHLGHSKSYWNPNMAKFILGERSGIHIIDLEKTLACLRQAASVTAEIANKGGKILFVGTSEKLQRITYEAASYCNQFYVNQRWIGGTISNSKSIIGSMVKPDLVILLDLKRNLVAAQECENGNVPIIAVCDSDCDPRPITYPIPANDESLSGLELIAKSLAISAKKGIEGKII
jgi:small subunit ribosomal protein S2